MLKKILLTVLAFLVAALSSIFVLFEGFIVHLYDSRDLIPWTMYLVASGPLILVCVLGPIWWTGIKEIQGFALIGGTTLTLSPIVLGTLLGTGRTRYDLLDPLQLLVMIIVSSVLIGFISMLGVLPLKYLFQHVKDMDDGK